MRGSAPFVATVGLVLVAVTSPATATIWSGAPIAYTQPEPGDADVLIAGEVELTRDAFFGIYNGAREAAYSESSPAGTLWAFPQNNPGVLVEAAAFAQLEFAPWVEAIAMDPLGMLDQPAVLFLVDHDVYLDVRFTAWGARGAGGFAYVRSTIPEPGAGLLLSIGLVALSATGRPRPLAGPLSEAAAELRRTTPCGAESAP